MTKEVWIDLSGGGVSPCKLFVFQGSEVVIESETFESSQLEHEWIVTNVKEHEPTTVYYLRGEPRLEVALLAEDLDMNRADWTELYKRLRQVGYTKAEIKTLLELNEFADFHLNKAGIYE
jgi:hypothetical protein